MLTEKASVYGIRVVSPEDLKLLVQVAIETVARRRKRRQSMMTVAGDRLPLDLVESIARKYEGSH